MGSGKPRVKLPALTEWQVKAIGALEDSIAHWDRFATGTADPMEMTYADDCACCREWLPDDIAKDMECVGCPVRARTGKRHCVDTPYRYASLRFDNGRCRDSQEFIDAARVMCDWLKETLEMVKEGKVQP